MTTPPYLSSTSNPWLSLTPSSDNVPSVQPYTTWEHGLLHMDVNLFWSAFRRRARHKAPTLGSLCLGQPHSGKIDLRGCLRSILRMRWYVNQGGTLVQEIATFKINSEKISDFRVNGYISSKVASMAIPRISSPSQKSNIRHFFKMFFFLNKNKRHFNFFNKRHFLNVFL